MNSEPYVRVPFFPDYEEARTFLRLIEGYPRRLFLSMRNRIYAHRGTPQDTQDWTEPSSWIAALLTGEERKLAERLWVESKGIVNPRYLMGAWLLCTQEDYLLLQTDSHDRIQITDAGRDFMDNPLGDTVKQIDYAEGLLHLLEIVSENGPGKRSDFIDHYSSFLAQYSDLRSPSVIKSNWYARMQNLVKRKLIERSGLTYQISATGLEYLEAVSHLLDASTASSGMPDPLRDIRRLLREQEEVVRKQIQETLLSMNAYLFEELIKRLLEAMGYVDVETTSRSNDGGVDVKGRIEVGITMVTEVVQVKRYHGSTGRPILDQLRGSLHRFDAMRGTIISTGKFSSGTKQAAFEKGAAPITLIDGDKLIDLLIEHEIGVRKEPIRLMKFERSDFIFSTEPNGTEA